MGCGKASRPGGAALRVLPGRGVRLGVSSGSPSFLLPDAPAASVSDLDFSSPALGFGTRAVHAGQAPDPTTGAVMTPVYFTSTYAQEAPGVHQGHEYARVTNPTRSALEGNLAALEGAT